MSMSKTQVIASAYERSDEMQKHRAELLGFQNDIYEIVSTLVEVESFDSDIMNNQCRQLKSYAEYFVQVVGIQQKCIQDAITEHERTSTEHIEPFPPKPNAARQDEMTEIIASFPELLSRMNNLISIGNRIREQLENQMFMNIGDTKARFVLKPGVELEVINTLVAEYNATLDDINGTFGRLKMKHPERLNFNLSDYKDGWYVKYEPEFDSSNVRNISPQDQNKSPQLQKSPYPQMQTRVAPLYETPVPNLTDDKEMEFVIRVSPRLYGLIVAQECKHGNIEAAMTKRVHKSINGSLHYAVLKPGVTLSGVNDAVKDYNDSIDEIVSLFTLLKTNDPALWNFELSSYRDGLYTTHLKHYMEAQLLDHKGIVQFGQNPMVDTEEQKTDPIVVEQNPPTATQEFLAALRKNESFEDDLHALLKRIEVLEKAFQSIPVAAPIEPPISNRDKDTDAVTTPTVEVVLKDGIIVSMDSM